jgi:polyhydroxyalkanoate synthesis regulator phasin
MTVDRGLLARIRARGEEVFTQVSSELTQNPRFVKAMDSALRGKERVEGAVAQALKKMNVPSRGELKQALARIEALEREVASLRRKPRPRGSARRVPKRPGPRRPSAG